MKEEDRYQYLPTTSRGAMGLELTVPLHLSSFPYHTVITCIATRTRMRGTRDVDDRHRIGVRGGG